MSKIADQLMLVKQQIKQCADQANRQAEDITLVAVSKTQPISAIQQAFEAGQRHFGENYVQESEPKILALDHLNTLIWHHLGPIQSNKCKTIAQYFHWVHSVDRFKVAERLNAHRDPQKSPLQICLQVNIDNDPHKSGCTPSEVVVLAQQLQTLKQIQLRGLMAIPTPNTGQKPFDDLAALWLDMRRQGFPLDTLSMGMSGDLPLAIAAGATIVRVGTTIFGDRNSAA